MRKCWACKFTCNLLNVSENQQLFINLRYFLVWKLNTVEPRLSGPRLSGLFTEVPTSLDNRGSTVIILAVAVKDSIGYWIIIGPRLYSIRYADFNKHASNYAHFLA